MPSSPAKTLSYPGAQARPRLEPQLLIFRLYFDLDSLFSHYHLLSACPQHAHPAESLQLARKPPQRLLTGRPRITRSFLREISQPRATETRQMKTRRMKTMKGGRTGMWEESDPSHIRSRTDFHSRVEICSSTLGAWAAVRWAGLPLVLRLATQYS